MRASSRKRPAIATRGSSGASFLATKTFTVCVRCSAAASLAGSVLSDKECREVMLAAFVSVPLSQRQRMFVEVNGVGVGCHGMETVVGN